MDSHTLKHPRGRWYDLGNMKLTVPNSLQSRLFLAGVVLLLVMALLSGVASVLAAHEQARTPGSEILVLRRHGWRLRLPFGY